MGALDLLLLLRLPAVSAAPAVARHAVLALAPRLLDEKIADDVALLVTELVTNSVRHGTADVTACVEISLRASPRALMVEVADAGRGFRGFRPRPVPVTDSKQPTIGGYGLLLVEELAQRWGIVDGASGSDNGRGARVWFEIEHPGSPVENSLHKA
jgi:anti-sigma regulatory factor (Ser/Thr protein kinase)